MAEIVDLHAHTTYSDGDLTPYELIARAARNNVKTLAITDHDTVGAYADSRTQEAADLFDINLVPGIEISTRGIANKIHILGLYVDINSPHITQVVEYQNEVRLRYAEQVKGLFIDNGWSLRDDCFKTNKVITKAYIADELLTEPDNNNIVHNLFGTNPNRGLFIESLMNPGGKYYIERENLRPEDAINAIHYAGGIAIYAHPVATVFEDGSYQAVVAALEKYDFDGLEALYYYFDKSSGDIEVNRVAQFTLLAKRFNLLITGGSDFHSDSSVIGNYVDIGFGNRERKFTSDGLAAISKAVQLKRPLDGGVGTRV